MVSIARPSDPRKPFGGTLPVFCAHSFHYELAISAWGSKRKSSKACSNIFSSPEPLGSQGELIAWQ